MELMDKKLRILILEDLPEDAELIERELRKGGIKFSSKRVDTKKAFLKELIEFEPDFILADYKLPSFDGLSALGIVLEKCPDVPFIFVSGTIGEELAIETLKTGATDYVLKNRLSRLVPAVNRALREVEERNKRKRAEQELKESAERLRYLSAQLLAAQENERKLIASEIHDSLGSSLGAIKFRVEQVLQKGGIGDPENIIPSIQKAIEESRRIQVALRPSSLDDLGILPTLNWFCREFQKTYSSVHIKTQINIEEKDVPDHLKTVVYRICQEAFNNIAKHSKAEVSTLSLRKTDKIEMVIEDNGRGFNLEEKLFAENPGRGLGLTSMRERAELSGGSFAIESIPGSGTTIRVSWPLER